MNQSCIHTFESRKFKVDFVSLIPDSSSALTSGFILYLSPVCSAMLSFQVLGKPYFYKKKEY